MNRHRDSDQDHVLRYPMHRMVAILDDEAAVQVALRELARAGIEPSGVVVLSGEEGVALLDPGGERHGLTGRLLRLAQWTAEEGNALEVHREALAAGKRVVYVPAHGQHQRDDVAAALTAAGGHDLAYFGRWTVEKSIGTE
jgi:hypothetical protein